jgi:biotin synthase
VPAATDLLADVRRALLDDRRQLTLGELTALAALPDAEVWALAAVAHDVRLAWCGDVVEVEGILAAKTGGCSEDCQFCSRSARYDSPVKPGPSPRRRRTHRYNHNLETARSHFPDIGSRG